MPEDFTIPQYIPTEDGRWVNEEFERLARVIEDYDPVFELRWIPPDMRATPEDHAKCFAVVDTGGNPEYVVFYAGMFDTPASILAKIFDADNKNGNVLERIDAHNAAIQLLEMKKKMDAAEERKDYIEFLIKTPKNFINMGNGRVVDDQLRTVRHGKR